MTKVSNIPLFLLQNPNLRKFIQFNGVHLDKITSIYFDEPVRREKIIFSHLISESKSGEITYIVKGNHFSMKVHSEKNVLRLVSKDLLEST